jgi:hypothetical protein
MRLTIDSVFAANFNENRYDINESVPELHHNCGKYKWHQLQESAHSDGLGRKYLPLGKMGKMLTYRLA